MGQTDRIPTFIHGFDENLGGGIPAGSLVLVAGEPGTMKSTIAFNVLYQNALHEGRTGVYMSLEQGRDNFTRHLNGMGLPPKDVESQVSLVDLGMIRRNLEGMAERTWLDIVKMYAGNLKRSLGYDLLAIDSLPVLVMLARFKDPRDDLFQLFDWLRELRATTFLVTEMKSGTEDFGAYGEEFLCDGILHVRMERVGDGTIERRIRCVKMRGTTHSPNDFTLHVDGGILRAASIPAE